MLYGKEHVKRYQETDGEEGHVWQNNTRVLILTTTGRKSGKPRSTPLIYRQWGDGWTIVASNGGEDAPPTWYLNIQANPEVRVQIKGDHFTARVRTATPEEKPEMWRRMTEVWPAYEEYQTKTDREILVLVLERV